MYSHLILTEILRSAKTTYMMVQWLEWVSLGNGVFCYDPGVMVQTLVRSNLGCAVLFDEQQISTASASVCWIGSECSPQI